MFATMARELAEVDGVRPTLQHLVTLAVTTVPCDWAAAVMAEQITAKPAPLAASSEPELFDEGPDLREGRIQPGLGRVRLGRHGALPRPGHRDPLPGVRGRHGAPDPHPVGLSFGLRRRDRSLGVLTVYGRRSESFDDDAVRRAAVLADHATVAIDAAVSADRADSLEIALQRNRITGTAVGILVERLRLTPAQAFDLLRVMSQHTNRKLADLAAHLVETGELPGVDDVPRVSSTSSV